MARTRYRGGGWLVLAGSILLGCGGAPARAPTVASPPAAPALPPPTPGSTLSPVTCEKLAEALRVRWTEQIERTIDDELEQWRATTCAVPRRDDRVRHSRRGRARAGSGDFGAASPPAAAPEQWSNVQVPGVDELDWVKTDGRYVYALGEHGLSVLTTEQEPQRIAAVKLSLCPRGLLLVGERLLVVSSETDQCDVDFAAMRNRPNPKHNLATHASVYDVSEPSRPQPIRELRFSNTLLAARLIGSVVHLVVADPHITLPERPAVGMDIRGFSGCFTPEAEAYTVGLAERLKKAWIDAIGPYPGMPSVIDGDRVQSLCNDAVLASNGGATTSIATLDLADALSPIRATTIASPGGTTMVSAKHLILAESGTEVTTIHDFSLGDGSRAARYVGSGAVRGSLIGQWALDEWNGYLRVASSGDGNTVSVLRLPERGDLKVVGLVPHLAPNEDLRAVRFAAERGFVVTFRDTDPLFVLDLHQPYAPRVEGKLEAPGFATYIHQLPGNQLLTVGFDAIPEDYTARVLGLKLQLVDVSNAAQPRVRHQLLIGTSGTTSAATSDHLAFDYSAERQLLALPMTICEGGGRSTYADQVTFSGLLVYHVDPIAGFRRLGGVPHPHPLTDASKACRNQWTDPNSVVRRSLFIGDHVFSVAADMVRVSRLTDLAHPIATIPLTVD